MLLFGLALTALSPTPGFAGFGADEIRGTVESLRKAQTERGEQLHSARRRLAEKLRPNLFTKETVSSGAVYGGKERYTGKEVLVVELLDGPNSHHGGGVKHSLRVFDADTGEELKSYAEEGAEITISFENGAHPAKQKFGTFVATPDYGSD